MLLSRPKINSRDLNDMVSNKFGRKITNVVNTTDLLHL